ncbi:MAG: hypothetical protein A4E56_01259 [Pelotomaculum sp. PtaU1.Bin065]|nr:MAG: hypothetical protein A4E56_01259 [Pelotomaculum sp. PtaU1.Bin065]
MKSKSDYIITVTIFPLHILVEKENPDYRRMVCVYLLTYLQKLGSKDVDEFTYPDGEEGYTEGLLETFPEFSISSGCFDDYLAANVFDCVTSAWQSDFISKDAENKAYIGYDFRKRSIKVNKIEIQWVTNTTTPEYVYIESFADGKLWELVKKVDINKPDDPKEIYWNQIIFLNEMPEKRFWRVRAGIGLPGRFAVGELKFYSKI